MTRFTEFRLFTSILNSAVHSSFFHNLSVFVLYTNTLIHSGNYFISQNSIVMCNGSISASYLYLTFTIIPSSSFFSHFISLFPLSLLNTLTHIHPKNTTIRTQPPSGYQPTALTHKRHIHDYNAGIPSLLFFYSSFSISRLSLDLHHQHTLIQTLTQLTHGHMHTPTTPSSLIHHLFQPSLCLAP